MIVDVMTMVDYDTDNLREISEHCNTVCFGHRPTYNEIIATYCEHFGISSDVPIALVAEQHRGSEDFMLLNSLLMITHQNHNFSSLMQRRL